jgi:membrane-associated protease RseP (regulator of RpoE activity)
MPLPESQEQPIDFVERPDFVPPPLPVTSVGRERRLKYLVLFVLTLATTTLAGAEHYAGFRIDFGNSTTQLPMREILFNGLWYSVPALLILGAHEFGHYFACRYYGVQSSLPYFIPVWLPIPMPQFGTFGAVIRIRQPIAIKRQLFDIGIAGPIAGFLVIVPVLLLGLSLSRLVPMPPKFQGIEFGEPLLFLLAERLWFGTVPAGYALNLHPMGWAAWFGLLATALNLAPIGQLDGGHISYAVLGRKSGIVTVIVALALVGLSVLSHGSYALWTVLIVVMLVIFGPHHPRAIDEDAPLDRTRLVLAALAAVIFTLSFTPFPARIIGS